MARQARSKMGWDEGNRTEIAGRAGLTGVIGSILRHNQSVNGSTSSMGYGRVEGIKAGLDFASVKQVEALLRRARMLQ